MSTPRYVYDLRMIGEEVQSIRDCFPNFKLKYSLKANSFLPVVEELASVVDGLDVSSWSEYEVARDCGRPSRVSITGPAKSRDLLSFSTLSLDPPLVHIESPRDAEVLGESVRGRVESLKVALRITPDSSSSGGQKMTHFGLSVEEAHALLDDLPYGLEVIGYQCYSGSQNLSHLDLQNNLRLTLETLESLVQRLPEISYLNVGGGFGVPYFEGERPLKLTSVGEYYERVREETNKSLGINPEWYLELGRYLVASSGRFECTVVDKRVRGSKTFLVVDGGMNHFSAASGNLGQLYQRNYPITTSSFRSGFQEYQIVGPLCTPIDVLGRDVLLRRTEVGDTITIWQAGAYGYEASPHQFLGHETPERVIE